MNDILEMMTLSWYTRIALNKGWSVSVRDGDVAKMLCVNCEWCEEKSC